MSGFSSAWLTLREPADIRARDGALLAALARHFAGRNGVSVLDLGCGTGASLRAMAAALPAVQHWRLVDHDPALLDAAREAVAAVPGVARGDVRVSFEAADLSAGIEPLLPPYGEACDLVTASALFDLVSEAWTARVVESLAARRVVLYATLIYDGTMHWQPPHPADAAICAAFNTHQRGDKGFGPAMGPDAGERLAGMLARAGYRVMSAPSVWMLGAADAALARATAEGVAYAVGEAAADGSRTGGGLSGGEIAAWRRMRGADAGASVEECRVGHVDVLAIPPRATEG